MPWFRSLVVLLLSAWIATAGEWPQWLGPNRDGSTTEKVATWKDAPKVLWSHPVGEGNSSPVIAGEPEPPQRWQLPDADERITHFQREEFRVRFIEDSWSGKIGSAQVLSGQRMSSLTASKTAADADYCIWFPGAGNLNNVLATDPDKTIQYSMSAHDQDQQAPTSIAFDLRTASGVQFGSLKCVFPRITSAAGITFSRWSAVVGDHLLFEVRP